MMVCSRGELDQLGWRDFLLQNDDISTEGQPTSTLCMYECIPNIYIYTHTCVQIIILHIKTFEIHSIYPAMLQLVIPPWSLANGPCSGELLRFSSLAVFMFMVKSWWIG